MTTPGPSRAGRRPSGVEALVAACAAALLAPLLLPALTGRVFVYNDLAWFHLPMRHLYQQALRAGDSVLWTPSILSGLYLHGEGQTGVFHPFHQLLYRLLPLGAAFNLELVLNYPAAFLGMFWFLRRLRLEPAAALFGAMLFAFSGFNLLHHHHVNMVAVVAHLPWLLGAADVLIVDERRRARTLAFGGVAAILGSELLLGFPQGVWWNLIALAGFGLFRAGETGRWRRLLPCAGAAALGGLIGGIQVLPSADVAAHSTRMELSRAFALTYSMHPYNLIQMWSPYFFERGAYSETDYMWFHDFGIYSGAILPTSLIWVWARRRALPGRRALVAAATAFAAVLLVLALGRYGGLAPLLTHVPGLGSLRAPVRYIVLVQFALAVLAAVAFEDLLAIAGGRRPAPVRSPVLVWVPAALGALTTLALNTGLLPYGRLTFASTAAAAPGVAIVALVTLLIVLAGRRVRWAIPVLVAATAADLAVWGIRFVYREPARPIAALTQGVPPAPTDPADAYAYAPERGPYSHNVLVLAGYRLTSGYVALYPATRHLPESDASRRLSGTRWIVARDGSRHRVHGSAERVRLLDDDGQPASGVARIEVDRPGVIVARIDAPGGRLLALTERFHGGWSASAGGAPLETVPVEGDFLGARVDEGVREVEFRFRPRSFVLGALLSALGAAMLAGVLLVRLR